MARDDLPASSMAAAMHGKVGLEFETKIRYNALPSICMSLNIFDLNRLVKEIATNDKRKLI